MSDGEQQEVKITSLDDLDNEAKEAANAVKSASAKNAIWDKALKALKPALADLEKIRKDAEKESDETKKLVKELQGNYEGSASDSIRTERINVEKKLKDSKKHVTEREKALQHCKETAIKTQRELDDSAAKFAKSQEELQGLSKQIQERQKALVALRTELKDADSKNQLVEAVVKLDDLKDMLQEFRKLIEPKSKDDQPSSEDDEPKSEDDRWIKLTAAANDLIQKTVDNLEAQAKVSEAEDDYNKAKTTYEEAQKNRLDRIKKKAVDVKIKEQPDGRTKVPAG